MSAAQVSMTIPLEHLIPSSTAMQVERRKQRTKEEVSNLAETIARVGVLQAIIVRPNPFPDHITNKNGKPLYEIVAGEGRYLAAKVAGLEEIKAEIRELTDEQAEEVQMIENLQRKDLNELLEAIGFEQLMKRGHTADAIAEKVGKSKRLVYTRLQLLKLSVEAQQAIRTGDLHSSIALLIARIPGEEQQQRALKHLTEKDWQGRSIGYRDAVKYVHETFMLKLSDAPFPCEDATLLPSAGACGPCPMRTGNSPDLFDDVKGANVCTNPECFKAKKAAHVKRELEKAKATGETVIRGGEAKRILPDTRGYYYSSDGSHKHLRNGYARPSDKCLDDPKKRTYAELAGKDAPKVLLQHPDTGRVEKVFKVEAIADRLKAKGVKPSPPAQDRAEAREQDQARRKQEEAIEMTARREIFAKIIDAAPKQLAREDLVILLGRVFSYGYGEDDNIYAALGWTPPKKTGDREKLFTNRLLDLPDSKLCQVALAMTVAFTITDTYEKATELEQLAKRLGIDVKKIRAAAALPHEPEKKAPTKASKKKPARKAK